VIDPRGPRLVLVATPIGNLGDLSPRSIETLAAAELICCEDTRRTGRLLQAAGVGGKRLRVCNEHTERDCLADVLAVLAAGGDVAVVTDAGTPAVSDPGELLVRAVLDAGYEVCAVPGPAALVAALVSSGLPTARFVFEGFLPRRGPERRRRLAEIADERRTVVLYEAPHRVLRTIADLAEACGPERPVAVARELTKLYETTVRGTLGDVDLGDPRGEYVIVLGGSADTTIEVSDEAIVAAIDGALARGASSRDAATRVAADLGVSRRRAYGVAIGRGPRN
jgi:16S rRNA (cytidine1402-2'-O)-methyltransferase